jgi:hypothetical protein
MGLRDIRLSLYMANEFYYTAPTHMDVNVKTPTCIHLFARDAPITNPASPLPLAPSLSSAIQRMRLAKGWGVVH